MTFLVIASIIPLAALGEPCGPDLPTHGACDGAHRVVWCEDNEVNALDCKPGTVCAWNDAIQVFDCLAPACGDDVPASGLCNPEGNVQYCDDGKVKLLQCNEGTECGWNAGIGAFDCLKASAWAEPEHYDQADAFEPDDTPADPGADSEPTGVGSSEEGVPPIKSPGDVPSYSADAAEKESGDGGCAAAAGGHSPLAPGTLLLLLALGLLVSCRRSA